MKEINSVREDAAPQSDPVAEEKLQRRPSKKNWLYESLDLSRLVHHRTVIRNLPFIFFLAGVGILYIANSHYAEKNVREIDQIEKQLNELRWEYMTTKSQLEYLSKQSEVAKMVEPAGLKQLREPPNKIVTIVNEQ
ncbi:MAG: FtsL-like putative cell division protein [Chitinophagales bacterium]